MDQLITLLKARGVLKSPAIEEALRQVDRKDFVPADLKDLAYLDEALPIGEGQTISQPYTVVFMLELLAAQTGDQIMDVGAGSAWQTALLATIVKNQGKIYAIERIPEVCQFGENNLTKYPQLKNRIRFFCQDAAAGIGAEKFDAIIAAAELRAVPPAWRQQLKTGGRLVYPSQQTVYKETKLAADKWDKEDYPGFVFVPFITT